jgi:hypothetical protein
MIALDWNPSARTLRQFAAVALVVLAGMAVIGYLRGGGAPALALPLGLGIAAGVLGWIRPQALRLVFVLLSLAVYPIGFVISHFILLILFYGVITPLGVLGRIARSDPLNLRRERTSTSYWRERRPPRDKASYLRQA